MLTGQTRALRESIHHELRTGREGTNSFPPHSAIVTCQERYSNVIVTFFTQLVQLARSKNLFLMEAMWMRTHPFVPKVYYLNTTIQCEHTHTPCNVRESMTLSYCDMNSHYTVA